MSRKERKYILVNRCQTLPRQSPLFCQWVENLRRLEWRNNDSCWVLTTCQGLVQGALCTSAHTVFTSTREQEDHPHGKMQKQRHREVNESASSCKTRNCRSQGLTQDKVARQSCWGDSGR